jgi:subtilase family serine protease
VDPLAPGESRTVVIAGRPCTPGAVMRATADATDAVDEHDESDDSLAVTCPPPPSA